MAEHVDSEELEAILRRAEVARLMGDKPLTAYRLAYDLRDARARIAELESLLIEYQTAGETAERG